IDASLHLVEVHAPGWEDPLLLFGEPQGPPTLDGRFPLRLRPLNPEQADQLKAEQGDDDEAFLQLPKPPQPEVEWHTDRFVLSKSRPAARTPNPEPAESTEPEDPESDALIGAQIAGGKFAILQLLGVGGAGKVYKARHRELRKTIAVKVLHFFYQRDLD